MEKSEKENQKNVVLSSKKNFARFVRFFFLPRYWICPPPHRPPNIISEYAPSVRAPFFPGRRVIYLHIFNLLIFARDLSNTFAYINKIPKNVYFLINLSR